MAESQTHERHRGETRSAHRPEQRRLDGICPEDVACEMSTRYRRDVGEMSAPRVEMAGTLLHVAELDGGADHLAREAAGEIGQRWRRNGRQR